VAWIPDSKQRATIQSLASFGLSATEIAAVLDCGATEKAVQSLCSREIALGEARAKAKLRQTLFSEATNGNSQALLHMVKERDRNADLCDSAELCSWLCCSRETLSNLVKSGVIERVARGMWDRRQCVQRTVTHLRAIAAGRQGAGEGSASIDLSLERALLARAQREAVEMSNEVERGNLIKRERHEDSVTAVAKICVRGLETLADRVERDMRVSPDVVEYIGHCVGELRDEIADAVAKA
jgi:phage terminase Nu1 subunit (DNA packaging protein)